MSFDGDDLIWTSHDFNHLLDTGYSMISLSRYTGSRNQRVISSRNRNFLFGYSWSLDWQMARGRMDCHSWSAGHGVAYAYRGDR